MVTVQKRDLSVKQVSEILGISVKLVRQLIKDKDGLAAFRPGKRSYKIRFADLEEFRNRRLREVEDE